MIEKDLSSWASFKDEVIQLREQLERWRSKQPGNVVAPLCFRGHASATWKMSTTLERSGHEAMGMAHYGGIMDQIYPEISAITGRSFDVPSYMKWRDWHANLMNTSMLPRGKLPAFEFMVYLRQHGFPSPLLDWTDSEYVAAFFAFADAILPRQEDRVAIFAYVESSGVKMTNSAAPMIVGMGPHVLTHPRHFTQQARYTYCVRLNVREWHFASHDLVFDADPSSLTNQQDVLYKFTIPASERRAVLAELQRVNLTPWGLFGTEESLMKTMAFKTL